MRNKQNGIVLLDVLIATVVLSVALVAIAVMFTNSTKNTAEAWQNTVATNIAAEQMNRIKTKYSQKKNFTVFFKIIHIHL